MGFTLDAMFNSFTIFYYSFKRSLIRYYQVVFSTDWNPPSLATLSCYKGNCGVRHCLRLCSEVHVKVKTCCPDCPGICACSRPSQTCLGFLCHKLQWQFSTVCRLPRLSHICWVFVVVFFLCSHFLFGCFLPFFYRFWRWILE